MQTAAWSEPACVAGAALTVERPERDKTRVRTAPAVPSLRQLRGRRRSLSCSAAVQLPPWKADVNDQPLRAWRDLASDWKVWLSLALCLLIATIAWLLGYD